MDKKEIVKMIDDILTNFSEDMSGDLADELWGLKQVVKNS